MRLADWWHGRQWGGTLKTNSPHAFRRVALSMAAVLAGGLVVGAGAGPAWASTGQSDVAVSTTNGLEVAAQPDGAPSSDWTIEKVAGATVTGGWAADWGSPSIYRQASGGLVLTSVRGFDHSLWFFWQGPGSTTWNAEEVAGADAVNPVFQPSIASQAVLVSGQTTYTFIVAENDDDQNGQVNGAQLYWQINGTPTWHAEEVPTGTGVAMQPNVSVAADNDALVSYVISDPTKSSPQIGFGVDVVKAGSTSFSSGVSVHTGTGVLQETAVLEEPNGTIAVSAGDVSDDTYFFYSPAGKLTTTWYQESVGKGNPSGTNPTGTATGESQPMALTGGDAGIDIGALSGTSECDVAYGQALGGSGWSAQNVGCSTYATLPAITLNTGNQGEAAAAVGSSRDAYFYWRAEGAGQPWEAEDIPGLTGNVLANTGVGIAAN
jgi:hypothetical protein